MEAGAWEPEAARAAAPARRLDGWALLALAILLPALLMLGLHALSQRYNTALPPEVQRLSEAWQFSDDSELLPARQPEHARRVLLPFAQSQVRGATLGANWLMLDFELGQPAQTPFLLSLQHRPSVTVYLDGELLAYSSVGDEVEIAQRGLMLGSRNLLVNVPPSMLVAGQHRLALRLFAPGFEGSSLSPVLLGPAEAVRSLQESRRAWQGARLVTALCGLIIGLFLLLVWLALRQEWLNGVTGIYCLLAALLLLPYLVGQPLLPAPWWRMLLDAADVVSKALMLFLVAKLLGWPTRWPQRLALAYALLGLPLDLWAAHAGLAWTDFQHPWPWWALGSRSLVLLVAWALALRAAWRSGRAVLGMGAAVVGLSVLAWMYVSYFALVERERFSVVDVNVVGYACLIMMAGFALQRRFVHSLRAQTQARAELEAALAQRSAELEARYRELQHSEQLRSAAEERERLLQEMHDGLGSQLLMAKLGAEQGMDRETLSRLLDDCVDEMRLTVDALAINDGDLSLLLANFRHRMGKRLGAAGLELDWQLGDTPSLPRLMGTHGRDLVRIVQEALSNVLHHAQATRVRFRTRLTEDGGAVLLSINDNGRGLPEAPRAGQGLRNMRKRAQRIGAEIAWRPGEEGGCEICLLIPVAPLERAL